MLRRVGCKGVEGGRWERAWEGGGELGIRFDGYGRKKELGREHLPQARPWSDGTIKAPLAFSIGSQISVEGLRDCWAQPGTGAGQGGSASTASTASTVLLWLTWTR